VHQQLRHQCWIVAAAAVVLFTNLGAVALWDEDEPLYASCAREMLQRGDWVVPTFNGEMFPEKPPLMFWLMMGCFRLFGVTELAARFSSAVLGVGTALLTYHLGRLLFRAEVGLWAGLIVVTSIIFTVSGRAATVDSALVFLTTAAILCLVAGGLGRQWAVGSRQSAVPLHSPFSTLHSPLSTLSSPLSTLHFVLFYACLGLAVLAKGPVGLVLPLAMIGLFLLIANRLQQPVGSRQWAVGSRSPLATLHSPLLGIFDPRNLVRIAWQMRPLTAIVVVGAVALPWYVLVGLRTDGAFLAEFLGQQNLGRALKPLQGHSGPCYYYLLAIAIGFFPWSVFLAPTLIESVRRIRQNHPTKMETIFVLCWLVVFVAFWSIPSTKLPHYVLTAYPALALLTAVFVDAWITDPACASRWWIRSATVTLVVVGVGMLVALPIVARIFLPGEWILGLVGVVLVVGGGLSLFYAERGRRFQSMAACAATAVVFLTAMFGFAALRVDRYQNAPVLTAEIRKASPGRPRLAGYRFFSESLVFYAGEPVPRCENAAQLQEFLHGAKHPYVVTTDEYEEEVRQHYPGEFFVLIRRPRFLQSGEVVVLARHRDQGVPQIATEPGAGTKR
jgi:4-amino-4-deoxy-L-arabinose transferase-like glycosyltransferase